MTDLLYIVRPSGWEYNEELRYALRSVEKHARNVGRIFVCGDIPAWLGDNVIQISCNNPFDRKAKNIMYRLLYAVQHSDISERFLWSSDDIFLTSDVDLDKYPHYWKNGAQISVPADQEQTKWGRIMAEARNFLAARGYNTNDYSNGHTLHLLSRAIISRIMPDVEAAQQTTYGIPPANLFGAAFDRYEHVRHVIRNDVKIGQNPPEDDIYAGGCFSTEDNPPKWNGDKLLQELYPTPSKWEK